MAGVMEVLGQAVSLPLEELKLRTNEPDAEVEARIGELEKIGFVHIKDTQRAGPGGISQNVQVVELTPKGFKASLR